MVCGVGFVRGQGLEPLKVLGMESGLVPQRLEQHSHLPVQGLSVLGVFFIVDVGDEHAQDTKEGGGHFRLVQA